MTKLDAMKTVLSDMLVDNAVKDLMQQHEAANDCLFFQISESKFCVKKFYWEPFDPDDDLVTRCDRKRIVEAITH
jgi:hypothetical protein